MIDLAAAQRAVYEALRSAADAPCFVRLCLDHGALWVSDLPRRTGRLVSASTAETLAELMAGGLLFGAVFMATDYVTSPFTTGGKVIYGIVIGLLTFVIRNFGSMNEGMSFAILMGNLLTPWFNAWSHQIPLGRVKPKKAKTKAASAAGKGGAA